MKSYRWILASIVALGGVVYAEPGGGQGQGPGGKGGDHRPPSFEEMDTNNDGTVSLGEFVESHQKSLEKRFRNIDSNNDGQLSQGELDQARERMEKRRPRDE